MANVNRHAEALLKYPLIEQSLCCIGDSSLSLSMTVTIKIVYRNLLTSLNGRLNVSATPL